MSDKQTNNMIEQLIKQIEEEVVSRITKEVAPAFSKRILEIVDVDGDKKVIVNDGHEKLTELVENISMGIHTMLIGPTGSGKTLGVIQAAEKLNMPLAIKQVNRMTSPYEMLGYKSPSGEYIKGAFSDIIEKGGIIFVDEIDNGNENTNLVLKGIFAGMIAMPYGMKKIDSKIVVVAAANTWGTGATREYVGRNVQDSALLNEFACIEWNYDRELERSIVPKEYTEYLEALWRLRENIENKGIRIILSTRNIATIIKMVAHGRNFIESIKSCVVKNNTDDLSRILEGVTIPSKKRQ